ncbi:hypothetical protein DFH07DRAFT_958528 [Mycena maculata]|uniref:Uncharacterized protein n=1 Tax=Mycena maculata TaxID=230809 RepID=A0AAD7J835_9AGAR|nr:hypothetical protein DFH07DRAFT_958528 [Mycena maculata]
MAWIVVTPFPGAVPTTPATPVTLDPVGRCSCICSDLFPPSRNNVERILALATPWPSITRTIWQDHARYLEMYMNPYPGLFYTGDSAARDVDGVAMLAEIESALIIHKGVAETAGLGPGVLKPLSVRKEAQGKSEHRVVARHPKRSNVV